MIRFISCLRRKTEISQAEFQRFWESDELDSLVMRMAEAIGADHYTKKRTLVVDANVQIQRIRGGADPFDGIIEYWFSGPVAGLEEIFAIDANRELMEQMNACQSRFADLSRSCGFFTEG